MNLFLETRKGSFARRATLDQTVDLYYRRETSPQTASYWRKVIKMHLNLLPAVLPFRADPKKLRLFWFSSVEIGPQNFVC